MSVPQNPSAFPHGPQFDQYGEEFYDFHPGMTLRDWFAGQALAGMIANPQVTGGLEASARAAYRAADAMLRERAMQA